MYILKARAIPQALLRVERKEEMAINANVLAILQSMMKKICRDQMVVYLYRVKMALFLALI